MQAKQVSHPPIQWNTALPFIIVHLTVLGVLWTGITWTSSFICLGLYILRMWAITAGYHRYFSHKSFSTNRVFQFILAFLAQTSAQQGVIWWANHHRKHHLHSDTAQDVHSPRQQGFWYSHVGWIFSEDHLSHEYTMVKDWQQYPELVWLDRHQYLPATLLGGIVFLCAGWTGLFAGFFLSTVLLYHGTFFINSLSHVYGRQRYYTADDSRNNWWLAIITLGEGWHNNHHHYPVSTRQGFLWWEYDFTFYVLKLLSWFGIVWDLQAPPKEIVRNTEVLSLKLFERSNKLMESIKLNWNALGEKAHEISVNMSSLINQPAATFTQKMQEMQIAIQQFKQLLQEKRKHVEQLPPKLAKKLRSQLELAQQTLENAIAQLAVRSHLQNAVESCKKLVDSLDMRQTLNVAS